MKIVQREDDWLVDEVIANPDGAAGLVTELEIERNEVAGPLLEPNGAELIPGQLVRGGR